MVILWNPFLHYEHFSTCRWRLIFKVGGRERCGPLCYAIILLNALQHSHYLVLKDIKNMADSFLYGLAVEISKRLASVIEKEIDLVVGVESELNEFVQTLTTVKAVLLDAEERPEKSHALEVWLGRLNDVCFDADDMLGEFELETLRQETDASWSGRMKVCKFSSHSNLTFRSQMGHKLQNLKESLDKIAAERGKFHLTERVPENGCAVPMDREKPRERETDSFVPTSDVVGRDDDKAKIFALLTCASDGETVSVIPIHGIAGMGKTTLAKLLYDDERVRNHFQLRIWAWVSQEFDLKKMAKEIIISAGHNDCGDLKWDKLEKLLRETLKDKLFLLILDDVWDIDRATWVDLKNLLMDGANGSKIIVTTRDRSVADTVCTNPEYICQLGPLPDEECFFLFVNWAFRKGEEKRHANLLKIGEEIVQKCKGVPFELRTLGSTLFKTRDVREWQEVRDKLKQRGTDVSLLTLRLSYDRLPSHLKKCFAYCSNFPKNYRFNSLELIRLWIAQGFVKSSDGSTQLEFVGWKYIKELGSFFQHVEEHGGDVLTFEMHDLIHDLASSVTQSESSPGKIYSRSDRQLSITEYLPPKKVKSFLPRENNVRTIIRPNGGAISKSFAKTCISRFKYLRVLDLRDSQFEVLPSSISELKLLRYLNLQNSSIKKLPNFICSLLSLQTLDLSNCRQLLKLPRDIGKLINLRCLYITTKQKSLPEDGINCLKSLCFLGIVGCCNLTSLCEGMTHLIALKTLLIEDCRSLKNLPRSMMDLTALETLFIYSCEKLDLMENLEDVQGRDLGLRSVWIARLPQLEALPQWLQCATATLQHVGIGDCRNLTKLPEWLQSFKWLQKLVIENCPELSVLPEGMHSSPALQLKIKNCPKLPHLAHITPDEETPDEVGICRSRND